MKNKSKKEMKKEEKRGGVSSLSFLGKDGLFRWNYWLQQRKFVVIQIHPELP